MLNVSMKTKELREMIYNIEFDVSRSPRPLPLGSPHPSLLDPFLPRPLTRWCVQSSHGRVPDMKQLSMMLIGAHACAAPRRWCRRVPTALPRA